jgi:hypothetical protein
VHYLVSISLFVQKKEKWAKLIGWYLPLSHKLSNVPTGTKRLGTTGLEETAVSSNLSLLHVLLPSWPGCGKRLLPDTGEWFASCPSRFIHEERILVCSGQGAGWAPEAVRRMRQTEKFSRQHICWNISDYAHTKLSAVSLSHLMWKWSQKEDLEVDMLSMM